MAWSTLRTLYKVPARDFEVILGSGGAPDVSIESTRGIAVRADSADLGTLLYVTQDGGTTWALSSEAASTDITAAGTGVVATSESLAVKQALLTLTNTPVVLADEAGVVAYGSLKIADLPEGAICVLGAVADLDLTKSSAGVNDDWDGDFALGTAAASNNATLSGTEADIIPSTATPQASSGATTANGQSTATECPAFFDGTSTAADVYLNVLVDDADHDVTSTACNIIANGTVKLTYVVLGDY